MPMKKLLVFQLLNIGWILANTPIMNKLRLIMAKELLDMIWNNKKLVVMGSGEFVSSYLAKKITGMGLK
jgi:hypothetical protein